MECHTEDLVCAGKSDNTATHIAIAVPVVVVAVVVLIFVCIYLRVKKPRKKFESKLKY